MDSDNSNTREIKFLQDFQCLEKRRGFCRRLCHAAELSAVLPGMLRAAPAGRQGEHPTEPPVPDAVPTGVREAASARWHSAVIPFFLPTQEAALTPV